MSESPIYDIAIIGAGPVGMALAGALARRSATARLSIVLIDARDASAAATDPRVMALSHGSRVLLDPLGWPSDVTPIEKIHVSQRGHFGRALIDRAEHQVAALGYVVRYGVLCRSLRQGLERVISKGAGIDWIERHNVVDITQSSDIVTLSLVAAETTQTVRARLAIHAEGGLFQRATHVAPAPTAIPHAVNGPDSFAGETRKSRDYAQTAIVGTVRCSAPRANMAWERFTDEGPIALLPLSDNAQSPSVGQTATPFGPQFCHYALVWCQSPQAAARRALLTDADLLKELDVAFGDRVGTFLAIQGRAAFALGLTHRASLVDGRCAAIGNAAQTLHPVAGQGLNLGLRDAEALAQALGQHGATSAALQQFAANRRIDRRITIGLTDWLARGFTVDLAPLALARGLALSALDVLPGVKHLLARQMMFGQRR